MKLLRELMNKVNLGNIVFSNDSSFVLVGGINVLESRDFAIETAGIYKEICSKLSIPLVFKASYDKANRSSIDSFRGPGVKKGMEIFCEIKEKLLLPVITDVHNIEEAEIASKYCDVIQIPAFLARQTDLVEAIAKTKKIVNIKKPQFLSPTQMKNIVDKFIFFGNNKLLICERGTNFGYDNLVVDMLGFGVIKKLCYGLPLIFDVTHSLQCREINGNVSGGRRSQCLDLAKAAISQKIAGLFLESHPEPNKALCDGPSALPLNLLEPFLYQLKEIDTLVKRQDELIIN